MKCNNKSPVKKQTFNIDVECGTLQDLDNNDEDASKFEIRGIWEGCDLEHQEWSGTGKRS